MENLKTSLIVDILPVPSEVIEPVAPPPPPLPGYMRLLKTSEQGRFVKFMFSKNHSELEWDFCDG